MLNGAVDISTRAELAISGEQLRDLWRLARERGVVVTVVELVAGGYAATIAGHGQQTTSTSHHPYMAAIAALEKAPAAA